MIHEYGLPYPKTFEYTDLARHRKIPLIEDCAHTIDSQFKNGKYVGIVGDYTIFSLSKRFSVQQVEPLRYPVIFDECDSANRSFEKYGPYIASYSTKRKEIFSQLNNQFSLFDSAYYCDSNRASRHFLAANINRLEICNKMSGNTGLGGSNESYLGRLQTQPLNVHTNDMLRFLREYNC